MSVTHILGQRGLQQIWTNIYHGVTWSLENETSVLQDAYHGTLLKKHLRTIDSLPVFQWELYRYMNAVMLQ